MELVFSSESFALTYTFCCSHCSFTISFRLLPSFAFVHENGMDIPNSPHLVDLEPSLESRTISTDRMILKFKTFLVRAYICICFFTILPVVGIQWVFLYFFFCSFKYRLYVISASRFLFKRISL